MKQILFFIYSCFLISNLAAQEIAVLPKNEWHFSIHADYFSKNSLAQNSTGYTDVKIVSNGGYRMSFAYRRYLMAGIFGEAKITYGRLWTGFSANYDFSKFTQTNTLQYGESEVSKQYDREAVSLTISTGSRNKISKNLDGHLKAGIRLSHFVKSQFDNRIHGVLVVNTNEWLPYLNTNIKLPGGKEKHFNGRSYIIPALDIETGISFHRQKWGNRAMHFNIGVSCVCLTQEGEGTMDFTYYDISGTAIGHALFKSRLLSLSVGVGLSF